MGRSLAVGGRGVETAGLLWYSAYLGFPFHCYSPPINRAPVLTLWAAVVAERLGLDHDEALTMGKALSGLTAQVKGVRLGIYEPTPETVSDQRKALQQGEEIFLDKGSMEIDLTPDGARSIARRLLLAADVAEEECIV